MDAVEQNKKARLKELVDARDNILRQLDVLQQGGIYVPWNRDGQGAAATAELKDTLRQLEECIAELESE